MERKEENVRAADEGDLIEVRRGKLRELKESGKNPFAVERFDRTASSAEIRGGFPGNDGQTVRAAGRLMSKRIMGKASFAHLMDGDGQIQLYFRRDVVGEEAYAAFKRYDIGDIVGVEGEVFATQTGEVTVKVSKSEMLSKSLIPLPEKFHGLTDPDLRYRRRCVDLIMNPDVKRTFVLRSRIISGIRSYLDERGFIEVETPVLINVASGAKARPFVTHHNTLDMDMYLRIAHELYLKRLIIGGFEKVYEIGRVFRNEGMDQSHNPEFTLLELYEAYADVEDMMDITEGLIRHLAKNLCGGGKVSFGGKEIDLDKPFTRLTMTEAVKRSSGVDFEKIQTVEEARAEADRHGVEYEEHHGKGGILSLFFEKFCEDNFVQPTFVTGYPVEISPLAKKDAANPELTRRFELFIAGHEYANAFSELNDPDDQRERFERQAELRVRGDEEANEPDRDFLTAMEYGMPPAGGLGIGVDRLVMLLTGETSVRDVLLFPTMKPLE